MKRLPGACPLPDALVLRLARPSCANSRTRLVLPYPPASGQLFNVAWSRNRYSVINARVKFRQLLKQFSLLESFPALPVPIQTHRELLSYTACDTLRSKRETFFCCWERQKAHSSFARMLSAAVGMS